MSEGSVHVCELLPSLVAERIGYAPFWTAIVATPIRQHPKGIDSVRT